MGGRGGGYRSRPTKVVACYEKKVDDDDSDSSHLLEFVSILLVSEIYVQKRSTNSTS